MGADENGIVRRIIRAFLSLGGPDVRIRQFLDLGSGGFRALSHEIGDLNYTNVLRCLVGENTRA